MFSDCMDCIHKLLNDPSVLVKHHITSYDLFIKTIPSIIQQQNPLIIFKKMVGDEFKHECNTIKEILEIINAPIQHHPLGLKQVDIFW